MSNVNQAFTSAVLIDWFIGQPVFGKNFGNSRANICSTKRKGLALETKFDNLQKVLSGLRKKDIEEKLEIPDSASTGILNKGSEIHDTYHPLSMAPSHKCQSFLHMCTLYTQIVSSQHKAYHKI